MEQKKICYRCLLEDMDEKKIMTEVKELIESIPEEDKTDEAEYRRRLINGTCKKCGCYVELRAAGRKRTCPDTENRWG